jgi:hypothetical protein
MHSSWRSARGAPCESALLTAIIRAAYRYTAAGTRTAGRADADGFAAAGVAGPSVATLSDRIRQAWRRCRGTACGPAQRELDSPSACGCGRLRRLTRRREIFGIVGHKTTTKLHLDMKIGIASLAAVDQLQGHQAVAMLDLSADSQPAEVLTAVLNVLLDLPLDFGVGAPIRLCEHASEGGRSGSDLLEGRIDLETPGRPVGSLGRRSRWRGIQLALSRRRPFVEKGLEARHAVNRHSTGACGPDLEGEGLGRSLCECVGAAISADAATGPRQLP